MCELEVAPHQDGFDGRQDDDQRDQCRDSHHSSGGIKPTATQPTMRAMNARQTPTRTDHRRTSRTNTPIPNSKSFAAPIGAARLTCRGWCAAGRSQGFGQTWSRRLIVFSRLGLLEGHQVKADQVKGIEVDASADRDTFAATAVIQEIGGVEERGRDFAAFGRDQFVDGIDGEAVELVDEATVIADQASAAFVGKRHDAIRTVDKSFHLRCPEPTSQRTPVNLVTDRVGDPLVVVLGQTLRKGGDVAGDLIFQPPALDLDKRTLLSRFDSPRRNRAGTNPVVHRIGADVENCGSFFRRCECGGGHAADRLSSSILAAAILIARRNACEKESRS